MKKKCIQCGRNFESGITHNLCSNSCRMILQIKFRRAARV